MSITIGTLPITSNPNRAGSPRAGTRLNTGTVPVKTLAGFRFVSGDRRDADDSVRRTEVRFEHRAKKFAIVHWGAAVGIPDQPGGQMEVQVLR